MVGSKWRRRTNKEITYRELGIVEIRKEYDSYDKNIHSKEKKLLSSCYERTKRRGRWMDAVQK